jgi:protein associated with RNAse G/E
MNIWQQGTTLIIRNIARSDGTVTTALPAIVIEDTSVVLALYVPKGTVFKNNWVIPPEQRVASVDAVVASAQRQYKEIVATNNSIRLYLPGQRFAVGLTFDETNDLISWYGNLEAPFIRTPIGIDSRDYALDVLVYPDGHWHWKDEEEFKRRLEVGIDSAAHQARVRAAGQEFIRRFENNLSPFSDGWQNWRYPTDWQARDLPDNWAADFGTHALLTADHQ